MKEVSYRKSLDRSRLTRITDDWINLYQEYYEFDNRIVKLIKYKKGSLYMETIKGKHLFDLDYNTLSEKEKKFIFREVVDIWTNHVNFKSSRLNIDEVFVHDDYNLGNLFYTGDSVRLLDPDSFKVQSLKTSFTYGCKFIDSFYSMQKIWNLSNETTI